MKSLLFQDGAVLSEPLACAPCRKEIEIVLRSEGRLYRVKVRDKIVIEDPYLMMVRATAFAIQTGEPFSGKTPDRGVRDFLIKSNVVI